MSRTATIKRKTGETDIGLELGLDPGESASKVATGLGFFDHMLDLLALHAHLDLAVTANGDLETGAHHTVEDVGIALGQALDAALGERSGINRYGSALVPMDEALAECAIDVSGRPLCVFEGEMPQATIAGFEAELAEEFLRAVAANSKLTVHLYLRSGSNAHHMVEAVFKAFARALREAIAIDQGVAGVPSTKGTLN